MDSPSFGETYSQFYNSLYDDKDYVGEARFVLSRASKRHPVWQARSIFSTSAAGRRVTLLNLLDTGIACVGSISRSECSISRAWRLPSFLRQSAAA